MICQLFLSFSFAWLLLKCRENLAYEIPNVDMEMLNKSGFEVSIPGMWCD